MIKKSTLSLMVALLSPIIFSGAVYATAAGNPPTINACMGMITSYGDHPEASPAKFAIVDGVSVKTLQSWDRAFCNSIR